MLEKEGILEKTNTTDYATPIVPVLKSDGTVRICGDFSVTLNKNLVVHEHPLPTTDELFANMAGGRYFSKIDLRKAYLQIELDSESAKLLTLNTHRGFYKCFRMMYGVSSAPAIWQRELEKMLQGIKGLGIFLDDIKVAGATFEEHLQRLNQVLERLNNYNIRINTDKCEFFKDQINYCGYVIDKDGIHKKS